MYRELTPADHRRVLGLEEGAVPDVLLVVGMFDIAAGLRRFGAYLEDAQDVKGYPAIVARSGPLRVALATCFGGPMAAHHVHSWCGAGVPAVVQLGWFGALQHGTALADVVVPRHAEREDGVSDWYLPKGILADATPELAGAIASNLRARTVPASEQAIYSTPALLAESREVIADWGRHGWYGVDMETAATFAVARSFGVRRAAALIRIDDLVNEEDSVAHEIPKERIRILREREKVVLDCVLEALKDGR